MNRVPERSRFSASVIEDDPIKQQQQLDEAQQIIRDLLRQIKQEQAKYDKVARAYQTTVANLVNITQDNNALERERDMWRGRAQGLAEPIDLASGEFRLTPAEISAIRKAIARLHHPDTGGDSERLKAWNAALDALE